MKYFYCLVIIFTPVLLQAQFTYRQDQSVQVLDQNGNSLPLAWGGGLNASQYSTLDFDGDGKDDLVIYDRMSNSVQTFRNAGFSYDYAPAYESFFPADLTNWLLLRDFNCDGKKDIFTGDIFGIKVYENITPDGATTPQWRKYLFYVGLNIPKSEALITKGFTNKVNLQLQYDDLPAIGDADGDGDLDIFNMRFTGTGTIEFHRNYSMERYGTCDSLEFERQTQKWGALTECNCESFAFNNEPCNTGGRVKHAVGKSLLSIDANADGKMDLLLSEASCNNLSLLINEGTDVYNPVVNADIDYPIDFPVDFLIFPAAYFEDVTFDGNKDLLAAPNIYSKVYLNADLKHSSWLYQNTGTDTEPSFEFVGKDFLQRDMIDVGDNAVPLFFDIDNDADYDMLVSQNNSESVSSGIYFYENIGTSTTPKFKLITQDYLGFRASEFYNLKIKLADFNGDGKQDLVFTGTSVNTAETHLYYIPNTGTFEFSLGNIQLINFTMSQPENISPMDENLDGLPDLLVGKADGSLALWRNKGSLNFELTDDTYLALGPSVFRQNLSCTVSDFNNDGKRDLLMGDQDGYLHLVSNFKNATDLSGVFENIIYNDVTSIYEKKKLSGRQWPVVVNLFNTEKPAIVTGNILGGLTILKHDDSGLVPNEPEFNDVVVELYPNPVGHHQSLRIQSNRSGSGKIISASGQILRSDIAFTAENITTLTISNLLAGVYIFQCSIGNKTITRRFVVY